MAFEYNPTAVMLASARRTQAAEQQLIAETVRLAEEVRSRHLAYAAELEGARAGRAFVELEFWYDMLQPRLLPGQVARIVTGDFGQGLATFPFSSRPYDTVANGSASGVVLTPGEVFVRLSRGDEYSFDVGIAGPPAAVREALRGERTLVGGKRLRRPRPEMLPAKHSNGADMGFAPPYWTQWVIVFANDPQWGGLAPTSRLSALEDWEKKLVRQGRTNYMFNDL
jgi:hypothetical protein